jgi:hypothetical protein
MTVGLSRRGLLRAPRPRREDCFMRSSNSNARGGAFSTAEIEAVWRKGRVVSGYDGRVYRQDACGAWMKRDEYGQTTRYGWEVDHIRPVAAGGTDHLSNLQPLYWENNRHKADNWPHWTCKVAA